MTVFDVDFDDAHADWPKRTDDRRSALVLNGFTASRSMELRHPGHADQTVHGSWATGVARAVGFGQGDTVNVIAGSRPTTGYVVARKSGDEFAPGVTNGITMSAHTFFGPHGPRQLAQYVQARKAALDGDTMVGIWHDRAHAEVALDLVEVVQDRGGAVSLGSANDQQAIFHIDSGTVIDTGGSGDRSLHGDHDRRPAGRGGRGPGGVGGDGDQPRPLYDLTDLRFNPNQPRDAQGRWGSGGVGSWAPSEQNETVVDSDGITRRIGGVEPVDYDTLPDRARQHVQAYVDKYGIDVDGMADDIVAAFDNPANSERGMRWYEDEMQADARGLAREFDVPLDVAMGTLAITSARNRWVQADGVTKPNTDTARAYLRDWRAGRFDGMTAAEAAATVQSGGYLQQEGFGTNVVAMLKGDRSVADAVTGAKRTSFFNDGTDPYGSRSITNDVWMAHYMTRRSSGSTTVDEATGETRTVSALTDDQVQSALSSPPPAYLTSLGVRQSPAYVVLSTATLRAHQRLIDAGRIPPDSVPSGVQATGWMAQPGGIA